LIGGAHEGRGYIRIRNALIGGAHEGRGYIRIRNPLIGGAHEGRGYIRPYTRTVASRPRNVTVEVAAMSGA
jgi:hypothetical protein